MAKDDKKEVWGMFIPAGLFIGAGFGFIYGQFVAGLCLGLGAGFILAIIGRLAMKK